MNRIVCSYLLFDSIQSGETLKLKNIPPFAETLTLTNMEQNQW